MADLRPVPDAPWVPPPKGRAVSKLCRGCGTVLHRFLIEEGVDYHWTCKPPRRRRDLKVVR